MSNMTTNQSIENATAKTQAEGRGVSLLMSILAGVFFAIGLLGFLFLPGCATYQIPTTEQIDGFIESVTESEAYAKIYAEIDARVKAYEAKKKQEVKPDDGEHAETPIPASTDSAGDAVAFSSLKWTYGGWDGSKAKFTGDAVISSLDVNNSKMHYQWEFGSGCQNIGASNGGDYSQTMACFFIKEPDGVWRGGKFDWISTSRKTRSFTNIHCGYHGWNAGQFKAAKECAFVIVSKGGYRTNVIRGAK